MGTLRPNFPENVLNDDVLRGDGTTKPENAHKAKRRLEPVVYTNIQRIRNNVARKGTTGCQARLV